MVYQFDAICKKGPAVRTTTHVEEEGSISESRAPDLKVADVAAEFDLVQIDAMRRSRLSMLHAILCGDNERISCGFDDLQLIR
jgi:hypothetical protein